MRTPEKRSLSGLTIEITPLGFTTQRRAFVILTKTLGPALVEALAGVDAKASDATKTASLKAAALDALERIDETTLETLTGIFAETSIAHFPGAIGKRSLVDDAEQDRAFGGPNFPRYLEWLRACVEVNFAPFFGAFGASLAPAPKGDTPA